MLTFDELGLSPRVLQAVNEMGFEETTPIQQQAIPIALQGRDLIGQAQTGTGKTAAFGIPMVERFDVDKEYIQGIVVTPTRELAIQVAEELYKIGQSKGITALPIYGGQNIERQIKALRKRPHIIVGTPGRLLDHIRRRTIRLKQIDIVVLDEADEMLNMGFIEDIEKILRETPAERQTLFFSATIPRSLMKIAQQFMKKPEMIGIKSKELTVPSTEQYYMEVQDNKKFSVLCRMLDIQSPELAIVFVRTKRRVDEIAEALNHYRGGAIIISASGMCDAGRIKHHLKHNLWRPESAVIFIGFQAEGTLGRRILDGTKKVKIMGELINVAAKIYSLQGFSAHADQAGLLNWVNGFTQKPRRVFIVHGEATESAALAELITKETGIATSIPKFSEEYLIKATQPEYMGVTEPLAAGAFDKRQQLLAAIGRLEQRISGLKKELLAEEYEDDEIRELDEAIQELEERVTL